MKFIALDLETTGLDPSTSEIIEIGAVKFENGNIVDSFNMLINPQVSIPKLATDITGITDSMVSGAKEFKNIKESLQNFIGDYDILGQNIKFDINFLSEKGLDLKNKQLDTFILAQSIIPKTESYSLEILANVLNIDQGSAHRAYDDSLASIKLMQKLQLRLLKEHDDTLNQIKIFLQNQKWPWKDMVLESIKNKIKFEKELENYTDTLSINLHGKPHNEIPHKLQTIELKGKKITEGYIDPEKYNFSEKTFVAMPSSRTFYYPKETFKFKYNYLIKEKLEDLLKKNIQWSTEEITVIIKLIIWFAHTNTYETTELNLQQKDYNIINQISIDEIEEHKIYNNRLQTLQANNKIFISHTNLIKIAILNLETGLDIKNLVILDAIEFEKVLQKSGVINIYLNDIKNNKNNEMIFGLLGIIFEKFAAKNIKFPEIQITNEIKTSKEFEKVLILINEVLTNSKILTPKLKTLKQLIESPNNFNIYIFKKYDSEIILKLEFKNILEILKNKLWNKFENIIINDDIIQYKNTNFLIEAMHLNGFETQIQSKEYSTIQTFPDLPHTNQKTFIEDSINKIILHSKDAKNILIFFPSTGQISNYYNNIKENLKFKNYTVLGQGMAGSNGKLMKKINKEGMNILLITFDFGLELIEIFKELNMKEFDLYFYKLPFMHPENSYMKYISEFYLDSYEAYQKYSIPKAMCKIQKIGRRYQNTFQNVKVTVLDTKFIKHI